MGIRSVLRAAIDEADARGEVLWAVGGAVRDIAGGFPVLDVDLATERDPLPLAKALRRRLGGRAEGFPRFGTASLDVSEHRLDFAACRSERYVRPGALPEVQLGASIEEDLARRDFTVNAMALGLAGPRSDELVDPFGGLEDLARRRLRVLHDGSFHDDATRLWRGARYTVRLRLAPEDGTRALIREGARWQAPISGERLWAEFERTAAESRPGAVLRLLDDWGTLAGVYAEWVLTKESRAALARVRGPVDAAFLLALATSPLASRAEIARRLNAPRDARRAVDDAVRLLEAGRTAEDHGPDLLEPLETTTDIAREAARRLGGTQQPALQMALRRWERTRPHLDAAALREVGITEGPALGEWLRRLRRERFSGNLRSVAAARRLTREQLSRDPVDPAAGTPEEPTR